MASNFINPGYGKKKNGSLLFIIIAIIAVIGIFICILVINGSKPKCDAPELKKDIVIELKILKPADLRPFCITFADWKIINYT